MIKVRNREEAWQEANSWISDLNVTLELNIYNKKTKGIDTIRINIEAEPEITETVKWSSSDIRNMCIKNEWYTAGDIKAYSKMLDFVEDNEPTKLNIWKVAQDILDHSSEDDLYVEAIMFTIANDVVKTFFEVH